MLVANQLGGLLLQADLAGLDPAQGATLISKVAADQTLPLLELYTDGLLTDRSLLEGFLAARGDHTAVNSHRRSKHERDFRD